MKDIISYYMVLKSAAGFYIGKLCCEYNGSILPYGRGGGYTQSKETAESWLKEYADMGERVEDYETFKARCVLKGYLNK